MQKLTTSATFDNYKNDPDQLQEEIEKEKESKFGFQLYGKWSIQKKWAW